MISENPAWKESLKLARLAFPQLSNAQRRAVAHTVFGYLKHGRVIPSAGVVLEDTFPQGKRRAGMRVETSEIR